MIHPEAAAAHGKVQRRTLPGPRYQATGASYVS
jgi:hypothetical protein